MLWMNRKLSTLQQYHYQCRKTVYLTDFSHAMNEQETVHTSAISLSVQENCLPDRLQSCYEWTGNCPLFGNITISAVKLFTWQTSVMLWMNRKLSTLRQYHYQCSKTVYLTDFSHAMNEQETVHSSAISLSVQENCLPDRLQSCYEWTGNCPLFGNITISAGKLFTWQTSVMLWMNRKLSTLRQYHYQCSKTVYLTDFSHAMNEQETVHSSAISLSVQ